MAETLGLLAMAAGVFFFAAGAVALLRFPDTLTRMHALTKADNLGLGLLILGLALRAETAGEAGILVVIWLLAMAASAPLATLLARLAVRRSSGGADP
ncbi:cation:proton antiporter [Thiohalorhabdus sp. Cl-TMA]|uniref:Cation:proton antiporter n=1 Tax=Thiohalorhabdus methylotrophus TaxID=3242694 RepID=A0ABV4TR74_9GAMM